MIQIPNTGSLEDYGSRGLNGLIRNCQDLCRDGHGELYLVESGDTPYTVLSTAGFDSERDQSLGPVEWIRWHPTAEAFELTYITDDSGYAVIFIAPLSTVSSELLKEIDQHDH